MITRIPVPRKYKCEFFFFLTFILNNSRGPRYCVNKGFPIRQAGIVLKDWEDRQLRPNYNARLLPKITAKPLLGAKMDCTPKLVCMTLNSHNQLFLEENRCSSA